MYLNTETESVRVHTRQRVRGFRGSGGKIGETARNKLKRSERGDDTRRAQRLKKL